MTFWDEFYPILCPIALLKKIISNTALKLHTKKWAFKHFGMFWLKGKKHLLLWDVQQHSRKLLGYLK